MLIAVVVGGAIYLLVTQNPQAGGGAQPAPSVSTSTSAAATPSASPPLVGPVANPLAATVNDEFTQRVLDFEEAYQMRNRPDGLPRLAPFGTEKYVLDHTPPPGAKYTLPGQDIVITVSRDLTKTNVVVTGSGQDASVRYVSVTPVISSSRPGTDGALVPVDTDLPTHQVHATTWKLVDGIWRVDQER